MRITINLQFCFCCADVIYRLSVPRNLYIYSDVKMSKNVIINYVTQKSEPTRKTPSPTKASINTGHWAVVHDALYGKSDFVLTMNS